MARNELRKNVKFYFANKKIKKEEKLNRTSELLLDYLILIFQHVIALRPKSINEWLESKMNSKLINSLGYMFSSCA